MSDPQPITDPDDIRVLRERAANAETADARATQAERRLAFLEVGVDSTSPVGQLFIDGYKGELTPEAITEAAAKVGAMRQAPAPADPGAPNPTKPVTQTYNAVEAAMQQLVQSGVQGEIPGGAKPPEADPDPVEHSFEDFTASMLAGRRREDAATHVLFGIMEAAAKGDKRVIFDKERDRNGTTRNIKLPNPVMGL